MFEEFENNNASEDNGGNRKTTVSKQPFSKWLKIASVSFIILLFFAVGIILGVYAIDNNSKDLALLNEIKKIVDTYYYGDIDWDNVDINTANAMLHYISQYNGISVENQSSQSGVFGLSLYPDSYNSRFVKQVSPKSVAASAVGKRVAVTKQNNLSGLTVQEVANNNFIYKIQRGDKIFGMLPYSIKNANSEREYVLLDGMSDDAYSEYMNLSQGRLVFERTAADGSAEYFEVPYSKGGSGAHYSSYGKLNGRADIGYIDLTTFSDESLFALYDSLRQYLQDESANKLILDLRGNGGGSVDVFQKIAPLFVPHSNIALPAMKLEDKYGGYDIRKLTYGAYSGVSSDYIGTHKTNNSPYDLIVLVDGNSASASEALCGVISCYNDRALIIGSDTYGKGVAQSEFEFDGGNIIVRVVTAKYYVPVDGGTAWQNFDGKTIPLDYNFFAKDNIGELTSDQILDFGKPYYDITQELPVAKAIEFFDTVN